MNNSQKETDEISIGSNDQMIKIITELGYQDSNDTNFISNKDVLKYFNNIQEQTKSEMNEKILEGLEDD